MALVGSLILALPALYQASTTIVFNPDEMTGSPVKPAATNELELRLGLVRQELMSRTEMQDVIESLDLYPLLREKESPETVIDRLRRDIVIEQQASTEPEWGQSSAYAVTIRYQDWDPDQVAVVANELADRFIASSERLRTAQAASRTALVDEQLREARQAVGLQEQRIDAFKRSHMKQLPEQQSYNLATLDRLNSQLQLNTERQMRLLDQRQRALSGARTRGLSEATAGLVGVQRLEQLQTNLENLRTRYTENHPDVMRLQKEIASLSAELGNGSQSPSASQAHELGSAVSMESLRAEEVRLRAAIAELVEEVERAPTAQANLRTLTLDYDTAKDEYLTLQKLHQEAQLAESVQAHQFQQSRIIEAAIRPEAPLGPNRLLLLVMGFIVAVGVAGVAVFIAEQADHSFHTLTDIRRFTSVPVLASISNIRTAGDRFRGFARFSLNSVMLLAGLLVLAGSGYFLGAHSQRLVQVLAG
jgi:polysaccharide chain length determinant protein (PEP-CTERM system associated)